MRRRVVEQQALVVWRDARKLEDATLDLLHHLVGPDVVQGESPHEIPAVTTKLQHPKLPLRDRAKSHTYGRAAMTIASPGPRHAGTSSAKSRYLITKTDVRALT